MGRPWSIVRCSADEVAAEEARWQRMLERTGCRRLRIPIWGTQSYLALEPWQPTNTYFNHDTEAEIRLLETPDLSWDDVDRLLGGQMIFMPLLSVAPTLVTLPGFEPKTLVGGLDRLLGLGHSTELEVMLRTAAMLARIRDYAILFSP